MQAAGQSEHQVQVWATRALVPTNRSRHARVWRRVPKDENPAANCARQPVAKRSDVLAGAIRSQEAPDRLHLRWPSNSIPQHAVALEQRPGTVARPCRKVRPDE